MSYHGIEHHIDFISRATIPKHLAYRCNIDETKEIPRQVEDLLGKVYVWESLSPCTVLLFLYLRNMDLGERALIVKL